VELAAVVRVFEKWQCPINIVTDSAYVAGVVSCMEFSHLKDVNNAQLFALFKTLRERIHRRIHPFFILHIRSHTALPGPLAEGNRLADSLAGAVVPGTFEQARRSHDFYHQNKALARMFHLPLTQARQIVAACPECQCAGPPQPGGVNP
ncbi:POK18 protein, partial [Oceanites oceanicus]|nr:POK18 protein [Oceanites oceanicus]